MMEQGFQDATAFLNSFDGDKGSLAIAPHDDFDVLRQGLPEFPSKAERIFGEPVLDAETTRHAMLLASQTELVQRLRDARQQDAKAMAFLQSFRLSVFWAWLKASMLMIALLVAFLVWLLL